MIIVKVLFNQIRKYNVGVKDYHNRRNIYEKKLLRQRIFITVGSTR